jgi:hypothetical protein
MPMMVMQCSCGAKTEMKILGGEFFHFGSYKLSMVKKYINNEKHEPRCLWCGIEFEPIKKILQQERKDISVIRNG